MPKNQVVIIVPGGLGTKLSLKALKTTTVWDFDPPWNLDGVRMLANPALMLPWLRLEPDGLLSNYDGLIAFIKNAGYTAGTDLFAFGYDWRLGMEVNAKLLAARVNAMALGGKKVVFIAHSAGCMIVRWALHMDATGNPAPNPALALIDNAKVTRVVAAGPPMLGMACAFKDVLRMPRLNDAVDKLFTLLKFVFPSLADVTEVPICRSLMAVTGQLEALTLNSIPILSGGSGGALGPFGVFDWKGWPAELNGLHGMVRATRTNLHVVNWGGVGCTLIASQDHDTDTGYHLDPQDKHQSDWPVAAGDGAVLLPSAQAYATTATVELVGERHRTLLDDPYARTVLTGILV